MYVHIYVQRMFRYINDKHQQSMKNKYQYYELSVLFVK